MDGKEGIAYGQDDRTRNGKAVVTSARTYNISIVILESALELVCPPLPDEL
ncbi:hypothetical protein [Dictyobacter arantiisoli]|uniref:hypothetical protein n=1 Tax=Dictyobacter arantiisoli TaxID=2014874 RepID=UPI00155B0D1F|nr:hypothetical protein [Dictyobacter arantiisoli]